MMKLCVGLQVSVWDKISKLYQNLINVFVLFLQSINHCCNHSTLSKQKMSNRCSTNITNFQHQVSPFLDERFCCPLAHCP